MANGFRGLRHSGGGNQRYTEYPIDPSSIAIFGGDACALDATSGTLEVISGDVANGVGVFIGCRYVAGNGEYKFSPYWPADTSATEVFGLVSGDSGMSYIVEADAADQTNVGDFCSVTANGGEVTQIGLSTQTVAVGATNGPFILRKMLEADNGKIMVEVTPVQSIEKGVA